MENIIDKLDYDFTRAQSRILEKATKKSYYLEGLGTNTLDAG